MKANVFIAASAGTGKTQALAERLIALVKGGLEPHEIVALTFSRAAAGEIFERFVSLLADFLKRRKIHEHIRGASVLREQKGASALARTRGTVREVVAEFGHWNDVFAGFEVDHGRLLWLVC